MPITLNEVARAVQASDASWTAGETSVSQLVNVPVSDANLFGLDLSDNEAEKLLAEARTLETATFQVTAPPPPAIDWRNVGGKNFVTSIKNQKTCGSCVAFATCGSLESRVAIGQEKADPTIDLSEAHLFFCGCGLCCKKGWRFDHALNWAKKGIGLEAAFPYTPTNQPCKNPQPNPAVSVPTWGAVNTMLARKQAISNNGPVIGGLRVYEDFYFYKSGVYKHVTGIFRGLHAVCIIGYDDPGQYWIIKNSWSTGWGDNGFMYIAYGQCDIDSTYAFYDPEVTTASAVVA